MTLRLFMACGPQTRSGLTTASADGFLVLGGTDSFSFSIVLPRSAVAIAGLREV